MRKILMVLGAGLVTAMNLCAFRAQAEELDGQIHKLTAKFEAMQSKPDKAIPPDLLRKAQGIVLLDRTKAGFLFAFQGGGGVAMARDTDGHWSPPAFLTANEASLGFQIGGEQNFFVILLMTTNAAHQLAASFMDFGGEARGTAGNQSAGAEGNATPKNSVLVFCDRAGLYGGAAIKGGAISADENANEIYYGHYLTMDDILFGKKAKPTEAATQLANTISQYSRK